jgi:hypothetical protein
MSRLPRGKRYDALRISTCILLSNLLRRRPTREPAMQIHTYDDDCVRKILTQHALVPLWSTQDRAGGGDVDSVFLIAQRRGS